MEKFRYIGYKERTTEIRTITIGELRHRMANTYLKKPNATFILMCIDSGERAELHSMEDALALSWSDGAKIDVIGLPHRWGVIDIDGNMEENAPMIIVLRESE